MIRRKSEGFFKATGWEKDEFLEKQGVFRP